MQMFVNEDLKLTALEVGDAFAKDVARLRFIIVVETSIESKHARVSLARRTHTIGPVKVSLSNRLPLLDTILFLGSTA